MEILKGDRVQFDQYDRILILGVANECYGSVAKFGKAIGISANTLSLALGAQHKTVSWLTAIKIMGNVRAYANQDEIDTTYDQWKRFIGLYASLNDATRLLQSFVDQYGAVEGCRLYNAVYEPFSPADPNNLPAYIH